MCSELSHVLINHLSTTLCTVLDFFFGSPKPDFPHSRKLPKWALEILVTKYLGCVFEHCHLVALLFYFPCSSLMAVAI